MRILDFGKNPASRRARRILGIAVCAAVSGSAIFSRADTTATWVSETSGDWTNTTQWSTAPNYPENGSPAGVNYQALVNATGGTPYTATIDSDISVDGITINSADATVDQTSGTVQAGTIDVSNGNYQMDGGTLANTSLNISGGSVGISNGTFNNVTVTSGTMSVGGLSAPAGTTLTVENGLSTTDAGTILLAPPSAGLMMVFDGPSQTENSLNLLGISNYYTIGAIEISGTNSSGPTTLTLGSQASLSGALTINDGAQPGDTLINYGTIDANNSLEINVTNFTNNGLAEADGGLLSIHSAHWSNPGQLAASNGGTLALSGTLTPAQLANISLDATSTLEIVGTLNNTNNTLAMPSAGSFVLWRGTIIGGTLNATASAPTVAGGTLDTVHIANGDLNVNNDLNIPTIVQGNLTLDSGFQINMATDGGYEAANAIEFDGGNRTVDNLTIQATPSMASGNPGIGEIAAGGPDTTGPVTVTLGPNFLFHGLVGVIDGTTLGCTVINNGAISSDYNTTPYFNTGVSSLISVDNFINNGTVQAIDGATLTIDSLNWSNAGILRAGSGGVLILGGDFTNSATISADSTSSVRINGTFNNAGSTFSVPNIGSYSLNGGTIIGGTIDESSGNLLKIEGFSVLNGVHVSSGDLDVNGTLTVENNLALDPGHSLDLEAGASFSTSGLDSYWTSALSLDLPAFTVDGYTINGRSNFEEQFNTLYVGGPDSGPTPTLTIGSSAVVVGAISLNNGLIPDDNPFLPYGTPLPATVINNGTMNADLNFIGMTISVSSFLNNGTVKATSGGTLVISSSNFVNGGTAQGNAGTLTINSQNLTNTGTIAAMNGGTAVINSNLTVAALGNWTVDATSTFQFGGTINNANSTLVLPATGTIELTGAIIGGTVDETSGNTLYTGGTVTLDGVHIVGGNLNEGTTPLVSSSLTHGLASPDGEIITIGGSDSDNTINVDNGLIVDPGFQLILAQNSNAPSLIFDGPSQTLNQITVDGTDTTQNYDAFNFVNAIQVGGGNSNSSPTLTIGPNSVLHGALIIENGSNATQEFKSTLINDGTISADLSGGTLTIGVSNFMNHGTLKATNGGTLQIFSPNFVNDGTLSIIGGTLTFNQPGSVFSPGTTGTFNVGEGTLSGSGTIDGNVVLQSDPSTLAFDLRSDGDFDTLAIDGNLTLAGNLDISLASGFDPPPGDLFTVLTVNSQDTMTGSFEDVADGGRLLTTDGLGSFLVNYGSGPYTNEIVLSDFEAVPEPTTGGLAVMTLAGLLARRRRGDPK